MSAVIAHQPVRFEFVGYGAHAPPDLEGRDRLYLDVGGRLGHCVVDHHHLKAYDGSAARLVLAHPDLVTACLGPARAPDSPVTIALHQEPDLDCVVSAFLAQRFLSGRAFPEGAEGLARYADRVDTGRAGATQANPFSLYSAIAQIGHRLSTQHRSRTYQWNRRVIEGIEATAHVLAAAAADRKAVPDVDAFACPGLFGPEDRQAVQGDLLRYRRKLADPRTCARDVLLRLPGVLGDSREVQALMARDVQGRGDAGDVLFFKDWARSDSERAPRGEGFCALSVFESSTGERPARARISVRPDDHVSLKGLGRLLDEAEARARIKAYGVDDRVVDPGSGMTKELRPGYDNADPWYDGRGHAYTILDSPRGGTLLAPEAVEEIFLEFARGAAAGGGPEAALPPEDGSDLSSDEALSQITSSVNAFRSRTGEAPVGAPADVFISYSRKDLDRVRSRLVAPVKDWLGEDRVFFDQESLGGGVSWMARIGDALKRCRVVLTAYSPNYFQSKFCKWELQLAMTRDPTGEEGILVPILLEAVDIPFEYGLIQAERADREDFPARLRKALARLLA